MITNHEVGGDEEANILRDADSLTFFNFDINFYYAEREYQKTKDKVRFMYSRLSEKAKNLVEVIEDQNFEIKKLINEAKEELA